MSRFTLFSCRTSYQRKNFFRKLSHATCIKIEFRHNVIHTCCIKFDIRHLFVLSNRKLWNCQKLCITLLDFIDFCFCFFVHCAHSSQLIIIIHLQAIRVKKGRSINSQFVMLYITIRKTFPLVGKFFYCFCNSYIDKSQQKCLQLFAYGSFRGKNLLSIVLKYCWIIHCQVTW